MIVLGLGSNLGCRLSNLRQALKLIKAHQNIDVKQVSPVYISDALLPENAPTAWQLPYLNAALRIETTLTPQALLAELKAIEKTIGRRDTYERWSPRIIDVDILVWEENAMETSSLTLPHPQLMERPFALFPLTDVAPLWHLDEVHPVLEAWKSRHTGDAPFHTKQIMQRIDTPKLVGVLNITPDSFSDGGRYLNLNDAVSQAKALVNHGADILDIGAQATSPNADMIGKDAEWARLSALLAALKDARDQFIVPPKISIDTFHPETAARAIDAGVDWINDVTGLTHPKMRECLAQHTNVDCVMMHSMSIPASGKAIVARDLNPIDVIMNWVTTRVREAEAAGIAKERLIVDPGIGFGKVPQHSLWLIKHAAYFKQLGLRLLYGHSRKLFMGLLTDKAFAERDIETATLALNLAKQDVDYLRLHHVELCARAFKANFSVAD